MKKVLIVLLCVVLVLCAVVVLHSVFSAQPAALDWLRWNFNRESGLPVYSGTIETGVDEPVEIYFDDYGVAHIFAQSEPDMTYAQGYVHAMERLVQMDFTRRLIAGRLSEIAGPSLLDDDCFYRTVGFYRAAELSLAAMTPETLYLLDRYTDGVNDYIQSNLDNLPPEFLILDYEPDPWEHVDTLAFAKLIAWEMGGNMNTELFLASLVDEVGMEKAQELFPAYPDDGLTIIDEYKAGLNSSAAAELIDMGGLTGSLTGLSGIGSNNWVVSGDRTASGGAILASDMHLTLDLPPLWYMNHLSIPGENISGVMFPGMPGVIAGFNEYIAWGETNLGPDVMDLYQIKFHEDDDILYLYNDDWEKAEIIEEVIRVRGGDDKTLRVRVTRHGPVITDVVELQPGELPLSLRWTALDATLEGEAMLGMIRATNFEEFRSALQNFMAPAMNFVYADVEGNIGYLGNGLFPIRSESHREAGNGLLPVPGWTDEYEWTGYVPWDEIPYLYNPPEGIIVTANNKVVGDDYPYFLSYEWAHPSRAMSIMRGLEGRDDLTLDDMMTGQSCLYNSHAAEMVPVFTEILEKASLNEQEQKALTVLTEWGDDPVEETDAAGPSIFHVLYTLLAKNMFEGQLSEQLFERLINCSYSVLDPMIIGGESVWFDDRDNLVEKSFRETVAKLSEYFGGEVNKWHWGEIHTLTFNHYVGSQISPKWYDRGPFPTGGSGSVPAALGFPRELELPFSVFSAAPWRYVIDMSDHTAYEMLAIGNSGHIHSPHYDDLLEMWLNFEYKTRLFDEAEIKKSERILKLIPQ